MLHLKPGDRLETWTESALGDHLKAPGDTLPPDFRPNPNTGPFYIEGAEPGDTLVVKLIRVEPASDFAVGIAGPGFGGLTQTRFTPMLDTRLDGRVQKFELRSHRQTHAPAQRVAVRRGIDGVPASHPIRANYSAP